MNKVVEICLSCKKFRPVDAETGICRLEKKQSVEEYPVKSHEDTCPEWVNCGQQYYIRLGWKKKLEESTGVDD